MLLTTPKAPGVDPNANRGPEMEAVGIAFLCVSIFTVGLRFLSRLCTHIAIALDDWLIVAAAVISWGYTATVIFEVRHNYYGQHIGKTDLAHVEEFTKGLYGLAITYPMALTLSKLSLLAIYWRIFRVTTARLPMQIAAALNIAWMIAAVLVGIFICIPIRGFWDTMVPSRCINYNVFFLSNEAFTIALDLVVLLMPVYFISQLQQSLSQRLSISSTFLLGLVVTIVSAVRLWRLVEAENDPGPDPTYTVTDAGLWAIIELNLWIVVASIPALRPLAGKVLHKGAWSSKGSGSSSSISNLKGRLWLYGRDRSTDERSAADHEYLRQTPSRMPQYTRPAIESSAQVPNHSRPWLPAEGDSWYESNESVEMGPGIRVDRRIEVRR